MLKVKLKEKNLNIWDQYTMQHKKKIMTYTSQNNLILKNKIFKKYQLKKIRLLNDQIKKN
jgi:hypothetical protein